VVLVGVACGRDGCGRDGSGRGSNSTATISGTIYCRDGDMAPASTLEMEKTHTDGSMQFARRHRTTGLGLLSG
jgi:hypothetical protein